MKIGKTTLAMLNVIVTLAAIIGPIVGRTIMDLTHTMDQNTPKWPLAGFGVRNLTYYDSNTLYAGDSFGMWVEVKRVEYYEHMGTHIDAPTHFGKGRQATHEIPPEKLIGPGIMIEVRTKVAQNPNYALTVEDIEDFEEKHGRIPPNAIVMMNTGWGEKVYDPKLNFGTDDPSNSSSFNFPGYSIEACKMLLTERRVSVFGIDTPSADRANILDCHVFLLNNNVPLLEYVANLDTMPPTGTTVFIGSPKHRGGTGGPTRVLAVIDDNDYDSTSDACKLQIWLSTMVILSSLAMLSK